MGYDGEQSGLKCGEWSETVQSGYGKIGWNLERVSGAGRGKWWSGERGSQK